jgi:hypothetical protein
MHFYNVQLCALSFFLVKIALSRMFNFCCEANVFLKYAMDVTDPLNQ